MDTVLLAKVPIVRIEIPSIMEKKDKSERKLALQAISSKIRDVLRSHAGGKPILRDMAERIQARKEARDNARLV